MLRALIHNKINEAIAEYQKQEFIISGDIEPLDAIHLDELEILLTQHIERICAKQPKEIPPSFYIYTDYEGIAHCVTHEEIDTDRFFTNISYVIAFDDCSGETVTDIYWRGQRVEYAGWKPGMRFEFEDLNGNIVWVGDFPHWDH